MLKRGPVRPAPGGDAPPPILVVDDLPAHATATAGTLRTDGYPILVEHDGDAVLERVRAQLVRLVVSELYVPCSEGRCVVTALKQERGRLPQLRVLVHTRHHAEADRTWALDAGADGVVPKTAPVAVLLREVRRLDALEPPHPLGPSDLGAVRGAAVANGGTAGGGRTRGDTAHAPPGRTGRERRDRGGDS
jgi:CheY-like chemotaxis protein